MFTEETERSYLDYLRSELVSYEAKRDRAARMLIDDTEYRALVLKGWDHAITSVKAQIAREEANAAPVQP